MNRKFSNCRLLAFKASFATQSAGLPQKEDATQRVGLSHPQRPGQDKQEAGGRGRQEREAQALSPAGCTWPLQQSPSPGFRPAL